MTQEDTSLENNSGKEQAAAVEQAEQISVSEEVPGNNKEEASATFANNKGANTENAGEYSAENLQQVNSDVAGLGVDIVEIERVQKVLKRTPRFKKRVYTEDEQKYCNSFKRQAHLHYATHFAAKEAALKALGTGIAHGIALQDIEVTHNKQGKPEIILHNKAKALAEQAGVLELHLSLSRTHTTAVANVIAITADVQPQPKEEEIDPREQLAREFKKLRSMLDNLEEAFTASTNEEQEQNGGQDQKQNEEQVQDSNEEQEQEQDQNALSDRYSKQVSAF